MAIHIQALRYFMASLQEQLMKSGLINKQKAQQVQTDKRRKAKQKKKKGSVEVSDMQISLNDQKQQNKQQDLDKNKETQAELALRAAHGKLIQMIAQHCEKNYQGEIDYHFTYSNKVKRIAVDSKTQKGLIRGELAICVLNEAFYLINKEAAAILAEIDPSVLVALHDKQEPLAAPEDDPYADFAIPDDLIW
ncbi:MAG: hypothetical protein ACJAYB_000843 [Psychromonas sp.]|jgi:uncharacterized protein YaiL (DUF2058 family)